MEYIFEYNVYIVIYLVMKHGQLTDTFMINYFWKNILHETEDCVPNPILPVLI